MASSALLREWWWGQNLRSACQFEEKGRYGPGKCIVRGTHVDFCWVASNLRMMRKPSLAFRRATSSGRTSKGEVRAESSSCERGNVKDRCWCAIVSGQWGSDRGSNRTIINVKEVD